VTIEQICRPGGVPNPDPQFCENLVFPSPSEFTIQVLAGNPSQPFSGSSQGTDTVLETGAYEVILLDVPEQPEFEEDAHYDMNLSKDYIGSIMTDEKTTIYEEGGTGATRELNARPHLTISS
jgi:hypothetical protein